MGQQLGPSSRCVPGPQTTSAQAIVPVEVPFDGSVASPLELLLVPELEATQSPSKQTAPEPQSRSELHAMRVGSL